eukprot:5346384-Prymnesium_polylepis.1
MSSRFSSASRRRHRCAVGRDCSRPAAACASQIVPQRDPRAKGARKRRVADGGAWQRRRGDGLATAWRRPGDGLANAWRHARSASRRASL